MKFILSLVVGSILATQAIGQTINGAGATFPYPLYSKWAVHYNEQTKIRINYQSIGSGAGIKQIIAKTVDFGASDMPLTDQQLEKDSLIQFPTVLGGVGIGFNLTSVDSVVISGPVLVDIYSKKITKWNDSRIAELNPTIKLPDIPIVVVYRSDGSGTTFAFTQYLNAVSDQWKNTVGSGVAVKFPTGVGAKGNEGVAVTVKQINGAIGYIEYATIKVNNIKNISLINKDGNVVIPSSKTFQAAANNIDWTKSPNFDVSMINMPGSDSWPITSPTFIILNKVTQTPQVNNRVYDFIKWAFDDGDKYANELDYVALPPSVKKLVLSHIEKILVK